MPNAYTPLVPMHYYTADLSVVGKHFPVLLQNGFALNTEHSIYLYHHHHHSICVVQAHSATGTIKNFGEKGAWAYFLSTPPIMPGTGKATTSNFVRTFQHRSEQKPITNFGKSSSGRSQRLSKFFRARWAPMY